ncbi:MAG TPA: hypothetical protein VG796_10425 [Verrucomicrobiales bacterium]|jgi:hypothetical protein|nr:hypothetical protein [Verrucomicrobiales bacterium]
MSYSKTLASPQKRSGCVNLVLIGTVVSICGFGLYSCMRDDDEVSDEEVTEVQSGRSYQNNHYVPGVGYYHAPFNAWFARPFNHYEPGMGYFAGGKWNGSPDNSGITSSYPDLSTVSRVNSQWRSENPGVVASRKAAIATSRGGFGSSFRSGGS